MATGVLAWERASRARRACVPRDPRLYQIAVLGGLLGYGICGLDFEVTAGPALAVVATALGTQALCARFDRRPFDPRSALISGLSLCLLLRTNSLVYAGAAAVVAIASKFVVRWRGKHIFNPTNFALVVMLALSDRVWVSPGQWGTAAFFGFLVACLGGLVVNRAARADVTCAFLAFHGAIALGRALWLGDPIWIPLHQLRNGALLVFAFFMISDPKTTPDSRVGRVVYAALVAAGVAVGQFGLYRPNSLLWALALLAPVVPILDRLLPGPRYRWEAVRAATPVRSAAGSSSLPLSTDSIEWPGLALAVEPIRPDTGQVRGRRSR